jgi:hypothetical protein
MKRLDWNDPAAVARWWAALVNAIDDLAEVADDATRPLRKRKLGPAEARPLFRDADRSLRSLLRYGEPAPATERGGADGGGR